MKRSRSIGIPVAALAAGILFSPAAPAADAGPAAETVVRPAAREGHVRNPGMGLVLYGEKYPGEKTLPEFVDVLFACAVWHDVEPKPGEYAWDDPATDLSRCLAAAERDGRQVAIRLVTSWQNYDSPIPDWLVAKGVRLIPQKMDKNFGFRCLYEPEWWNPDYQAAYEKLVRAYGKRFDGDPRIAWIDMRYYGFWGEGHRWGATEPWPADVDRAAFCRRWIDLHREVFPRTPLAVQTASDKDVPYPEGTAIDYALSKGCWMRRDGFGCFLSDKESAFLKSSWTGSLLIAENGRSLADHLAGKVKKDWVPGAKPIPIEDLFSEMLGHHVNYLPLGWGGAEAALLARERPALLAEAERKVGYRLVVEEARWTSPLSPGSAAGVRTTWRNLGVGRVPWAWRPALFFLDSRGKTKATAVAEGVDVSAWTDDAPREVVFPVPAKLASGEYALAVGVVDEAGEPRIDLASEGGDGKRRFSLGKARVRRK